MTTADQVILPNLGFHLGRCRTGNDLSPAGPTSSERPNGTRRDGPQMILHETQLRASAVVVRFSQRYVARSDCTSPVITSGRGLLAGTPAARTVESVRGSGRPSPAEVRGCALFLQYHTVCWKHNRSRRCPSG